MTETTAREALEAAERGSYSEPPHMGDMFAAGLQLRQIASFRRAIEDNPDIAASEWWVLLWEVAASNARRSAQDV